MKRISLLAVGLLVALMLGCETSTNKPTANSTPSKPTGTAATGNQTTTAQPAPDNTGVNERDRHTAAKTPIDQNENKADVERTADIRKRVLERENMSVNARNVKIITADGKVKFGQRNNRKLVDINPSE